MLSTRI